MADEHLEHLRRISELAGVEVAEFATPEDKHILLRNMRFHFLDWGTAGKPPIVFLHGGGLTAHTWDLVCLALRNDYHCQALSLRGHGESEWSPSMEYSIVAHAGDLGAFADQLGLEKFFVVGMSMGGLNAIRYAGSQSSRLAGIVLVDIGPDSSPLGAKRIADFMSITQELDSIDHFVERALKFNPLRNRDLLRRSLMHNLMQLPDGKWTWKYDARPQQRGHIAALEESQRQLWSEIPRITCPTLIVRGALSDVFSDEDAERLAEALPDAKWMRVENAGHTVQGDNPRGLIEAIRPFLDSLSGM